MPPTARAARGLGYGYHVAFSELPTALVEAPHGALQADIAERQDIAAQQREDEKHFRCPAPNPLDRDQLGDHRIIVKRGPAGRVEGAIDETQAKVLEIADFRALQPAAAQSLRRGLGYPAGVHPAEAFLQAAPNRFGGGNRYLLANDGSRQGAEGIVAAPQGLARIARDDAAEPRIASGEMGDGLRPIIRNHRAPVLHSPKETAHHTHSSDSNVIPLWGAS